MKRKRILIVLGFLNPDILAGFSRYAREADWILNAFSVFHNAVPPDWDADGLLTTNVFRPDLVRFVRKTARQIPTVLHGCDDLRLAVPNVECDEYQIGRMAAEHLLDQDHRHFAYFRYSDNIHAMRRRDGFRDALREAGYDCMDLEKISEHGNGAGEWFRKQLARLPKPLGLFAEDDLLAARVIETATDEGWQVPADLAVVGCGNIDLVCEFGPVPITSIDCPLEEQAYQAAAMLDTLMSGKKLPKQKARLSTRRPDRAGKHQLGGGESGTRQAGAGLHGAINCTIPLWTLERWRTTAGFRCGCFTGSLTKTSGARRWPVC